MAALSDETGTLKFVHTYGAGLHSGDARPDVHNPRWQQRQVATSSRSRCSPRNSASTGSLSPSTTRR